MSRVSGFNVLTWGSELKRVNPWQNISEHNLNRDRIAVDKRNTRDQGECIFEEGVNGKSEKDKGMGGEVGRKVCLIFAHISLNILCLSPLSLVYPVFVCLSNHLYFSSSFFTWITCFECCPYCSARCVTSLMVTNTCIRKTHKRPSHLFLALSLSL